MINNSDILTTRIKSQTKEILITSLETKKTIEDENQMDTTSLIITSATEEKHTEPKIVKIAKRKRVEEEDEDEHIPSIQSTDSFSIYNELKLIHNVMFKTTRSHNALGYTLDNFDFNGNNTIVMKLVIPESSPRWSINISPINNLDLQNIFLHFNPRYGKKTEIILNDKQCNWGRPIKLSLETQHKIDLVIIIRPEAFYIFMNSHKLLASFIHRRELTNYK